MLPDMPRGAQQGFHSCVPLRSNRSQRDLKLAIKRGYTLRRFLTSQAAGLLAVNLQAPAGFFQAPGGQDLLGRAKETTLIFFSPTACSDL